MILDSSEIIALEKNRGIVENLVAGREDELFGISLVHTLTDLIKVSDKPLCGGQPLRPKSSVRTL